MIGAAVSAALRTDPLSLRLQIGFALAVLLVGLSAFVLSARDAQRRGEEAQVQRAEDEFVRDEVQAAWDRVNEQQRAKADRLLSDGRARSEQQVGLSRRLAAGSPLPSLIFALTELADGGFRSHERYQRQADAYDRSLESFMDRRFAEEERCEPTFSVNDFLDLSGRPRFQYHDSPLKERIAAALPHAFLLAAWTAVFLLTAAVAFLRYDVR